MAFSLPSLPKLPFRLPSISAAPAAVLNVVSLIARNLPNVNPPVAIYAILDVETGVPLTIPDSWGELIQRSESQVSDYPVEDGAFAAYNKVKRPGSFDFVLVKTGSDLSRATWLEAIRQQIDVNPLARYNVITPQGIWQSYTITRMSHQTRQDRGSNMLYLELQFSEIPQIETPSFMGENTVDPTSGAMVDQGRIFSSVTPPSVAALARSGTSLGGFA